MAEPATIAVLGQYLDHFMAEGYSFTIYKYDFSPDVTVKLSKRTTAGAQVETTGQGATFAEALARALDNFPKFPGAGSWDTKRLAVPTIVVDNNEVPF